ncbi:MAG: hypothetical protein JOZ62_21385 [Acidobacteriaceae bacterium]|nr:hypothetical protein [Acidobacteriaceae bacterium]
MSAVLTPPLTAVDNPGQDLARRTVCIKVQRSRLGNSRKVSAAKVEVDTDKTLLRISKRLFDCNEYKAISNFDAEVSKYVESVCLPFEKGIHLCPLPLLQQVDQKLKDFAARRPALVEAFLNIYPDLCAQAPERHRALHDPRDFPSVEEVRQAFSFSWLSFGVPDKLRDIAPELWDEERTKAAQLLTNAAEEAQQVMRTALAELVQHLAERLQATDEGKPVRLHKSAVSNLLDFLDTLDFRNVTNDSDLKRLADEARALLTGVNMKDLKSTGDLRQRVREGMQQIATQLDSMLVSRGRKIRFDEE